MKMYNRDYPSCRHVVICEKMPDFDAKSYFNKFKDDDITHFWAFVGLSSGKCNPLVETANLQRREMQKLDWLDMIFAFMLDNNYPDSFFKNAQIVNEAGFKLANFSDEKLSDNIIKQIKRI